MIIRALVPVVFVLGIAAAAGPSPATPWPPATVSPRAADTLVELRRDDTQAAVKRLRAAGATLVGPRLEIWRVPAAVAPSIVPALVRAGLTRLVEPDRSLAPLAGTTSAAVQPASQWWLRTIGAAGLTPPAPASR